MAELFELITYTNTYMMKDMFDYNPILLRDIAAYSSNLLNVNTNSSKVTQSRKC